MAAAQKVTFNNTYTFDLTELPFEFESKFVVFTGTTLSGKTEVLNALGQPYQPEVARVYIERELEKGRTKEDIRSDEGKFQHELVKTKQEIEQETPKDRICFFDRAMPDSITYYRAAGLDPSIIVKPCKIVKYLMVFHFDPLPDLIVERIMQNDPVRTEDAKTRLLIDDWLERDYRSLGYDPTCHVRVPVMSVSDRTSFILNELLRRGVSIGELPQT